MQKRHGLAAPLSPVDKLTPTSETTPEQEFQAEHERYWQALDIAMAQSGPHPDRDTDLVTAQRWSRAVNRRFWKAYRRLN